MIKGIHLKQFQSFAEPIDIPWSDLTIAVGPNSAGKSAVADAVAYLAEAFKHLLDMDSDVDNLYGECRRRSPADADDRQSLDPGAGPHQSWYGRYIDRVFEVGVRVLDDLWIPALPAPQDMAGRLTREERQWVEGFLRSLHRRELKITLAGVVSGIRLEVDAVPLLEFADTEDQHPLRRLFVGSEEAQEAVVEWANEHYQDEYCGELRINLAHPCLSGSLPAALVDIRDLSSVGGELIRMFAPIESGWLTIGGLLVPMADSRSTAELFVLEAGNLTALDTGLSSLIKRVREDGSGSVLQQLEQLDRTSPLDMRRKLQTALLSASGQFHVVLKSVIRRLFEYVHRVGAVSGSRSVLGPKDCLYLEDDEHSGSPVLREFALRALESRAESKATAFVNRALEELLSGMRGLQVRIAVYKPAQYGASQLRHGAYSQKAAQIFVEDASGRQLMPWEVGSGLSYVLPILVALEQRETVLIQQPELHLHPAAQCEVADTVIAAVTKGGQVWVETHSEHFILRLLRRVRETTHDRCPNEKLRLKAGDVTVLFFQPQEDGTTRVLQLRVDDEGEFMDRWPGGFFAERDREMFDE